MNSPQHRGGRGLFADAVGVVGRNCGQLDAADSYALKSQLSPTGRSSHSHRRLACQPVRSSTLPHVERGTTHDRARSRAVQPRQHASPAPKCPVRTISEAPAEPPVGSAVRICTLSSPSSYAMKGKTGNTGKGGRVGRRGAGWLACGHAPSPPPTPRSRCIACHGRQGTWTCCVCSCGYCSSGWGWLGPRNGPRDTA